MKQTRDVTAAVLPTVSSGCLFVKEDRKEEVGLLNFKQATEGQTHLISGGSVHLASPFYTDLVSKNSWN